MTEQLQQGEFDALIADIHMPGNASLELIENVPQLADGLPVILLTGRPTVETAARSVRLAVIAYLVKPPNLDDLRELLRRAVADHRNRRAVLTTRRRLQEWDNDLKLIESDLRRTNASPAEPMNDYLKVTLRNLILSLCDLERATAPAAQPEANPAAGLQPMDLVGALRRTVEVLEKTKQSFKSKDLGELRKQLESLLKER